MNVLNLEAIRNTPMVESPFPHFIVDQCISESSVQALRDSFPKIERGGSFPLKSLEYGAAFEQLTQELQGAPLRQVFAEKFDLDLSGRPTTLTVRGQTRAKDGKIHTDSKTKLITVLLYLNPAWQTDGGCLRLLRSKDNIEDFITEVSPREGTLVAFKCVDNAWHGHKQFVGERRSLQLNWVVDQAAADGSRRRHGLSAMLKSLNPLRRSA